MGLAVAASSFAIWWLNSLNGLPDIGDPFDVAEFRAFRISDEQNAITLVRRAAKKFTPMPLNVGLGDPRLHDWFEANRPLVDLFIQAAERADGISGPEEVDDWRYYPIESNSGATMLINRVLGGLGEGYRVHVTLALAQLWQGGDPAIRQAIVEAVLTMGPASLD
jgi:hypothetical protein